MQLYNNETSLHILVIMCSGKIQLNVFKICLFLTVFNFKLTREKNRASRMQRGGKVDIVQMMRTELADMGGTSADRTGEGEPGSRGMDGGILAKGKYKWTGSMCAGAGGTGGVLAGRAVRPGSLFAVVGHLLSVVGRFLRFVFRSLCFRCSALL